MLIELKHLAAVLALVEHRHFQKAAEALGTSQPALSRTIRLIEEELGECLFDRRQRRVELTPVGEIFATFADDLMRWRAHKLDDIRQIVAARRGLVTIACLPSLSSTVALLASHFCASYPQVKVRLLEYPADRVLAAVQRGDADLGVGIFPDEETEFITSLFYTDELAAVGAAKNPLGAKKHLRWEHLRDARIIAMSRGSSIYRYVSEAFIRYKVPLEPVFEVNLMPTATSLAAEDFGVAVLPSSFTNNINHSDLWVKSLHPRVYRKIMLFRRKGRNLLPAALEMEAYLMRQRKV